MITLLASLGYGAMFYTSTRKEKRMIMRKEIHDPEKLLYSWRLFDITHMVFFAISILSSLIFVFSFAIGYFFRYTSARWLMYYTLMVSMTFFALFYAGLGVLGVEVIPGICLAGEQKFS